MTDAHWNIPAEETAMTDKKTQGNITDAIKALQQGARVYARGGEVTIRSGQLEWKCASILYPTQPVDAKDDAFRIEWSRKPKRGEWWKNGADDTLLMLCVDEEVYVCGREGALCWFNRRDEQWVYSRDATPEEMAQFDGGK